MLPDFSNLMYLKSLVEQSAYEWCQVRLTLRPKIHTCSLDIVNLFLDFVASESIALRHRTKSIAS